MDNSTNHPSNFRTQNWAEINYELKGKYDNSKIRFKTFVIRPNLSDYSDAYVPVKGTITVLNTTVAGAAVNNTNKRVKYKN